ncbi:hypothetical protein DV515_00007000 [Chloebia gouldiae]|uniref:Uncharacterized protein n=1 Tax=Chloebia gouldiae TaxID=44316 RepID=A0A3L8SKC1_CHLGU|nr:hypothetical protein DV515_00007000 [Chloebia gouldiae]
MGGQGWGSLRLVLMVWLILMRQGLPVRLRRDRQTSGSARKNLKIAAQGSWRILGMSKRKRDGT